MPAKENTERSRMGERLKEAREYLALSQDEVAQALHLPRSAISLIETAQRRVDVLELKEFARLYQRPLGYFTGEETHSQARPKEVEYLARAAAGLSHRDREELVRFAEFLKSKKDAKDT